MSRRRLVVLAFLLLLATLGIWLARQLQRPDLEPWAERWALPPAAAGASGSQVTVSWLGVATLVFRDGDTTLLTDGWFTRVSLWDLVRGTAVSPDADAITRGLARAGVDRAAVVIPVHSHYDHAQDSPEVAKRTGAVLLGSTTTAWIGRGAGLDETHIRVAEPGVPQRFGRFTVTLVPSRHVALPAGQGRLGEALEAPLVPPVPADAYPEGGSWSILIAHPLGTALVQGSAGFVPGALDDYRADAVFLGIGALGRFGPDYTRDYLHHIVDAVGARRIFPIHFDDLTRPSVDPPVSLPILLDDVNMSLERLRARAEADPKLSIGWLRPWQTATLFGAR